MTKPNPEVAMGWPVKITDARTPELVGRTGKLIGYQDGPGTRWWPDRFMVLLPNAARVSVRGVEVLDKPPST